MPSLIPLAPWPLTQTHGSNLPFWKFLFHQNSHPSPGGECRCHSCGCSGSRLLLLVQGQHHQSKHQVLVEPARSWARTHMWLWSSASKPWHSDEGRKDQPPHRLKRLEGPECGQISTSCSSVQSRVNLYVVVKLHLNWTGQTGHLLHLVHHHCQSHTLSHVHYVDQRQRRRLHDPPHPRWARNRGPHQTSFPNPAAESAPQRWTPASATNAVMEPGTLNRQHTVAGAPFSGWHAMRSYIPPYKHKWRSNANESQIERDMMLHNLTPNVSIYTISYIHGSYGYVWFVVCWMVQSLPSTPLDDHILPCLDKREPSNLPLSSPIPSQCACW